MKKSHTKEQLLNNKVVNISPVAKDDIVTTKQNIPLNIQVLGNDNDPNKKDKLSIIGSLVVLVICNKLIAFSCIALPVAENIMILDDVSL